MSYSFEYIDIILLAMIAGFIFLRLRGILGKKSGFEEDINSSFPQEAPTAKAKLDLNENTFDENAKKEFLKGAQIAYETIVTNFSKGKLKDIKSLLDISVFISSNISLDTSIDPKTACSASILFGNSLKLSLTKVKLLFMIQLYNKNH